LNKLVKTNMKHSYKNTALSL